MLTELKKIVTLSRPRFWLYTLGPFLVGSVLAAQSVEIFMQPLFWIAFVYFWFFANVFVYGVNDICDQDTDAHNKKKTTHEYAYVKKDKIIVYGAVCISVLFALLLVPLSTPTSVFFLAGFLLLGGFYSAPPIRFKARPFVDSWSNVLYLMPGFYAYSVFGGNVDFWLLPALGLWTAGMHLYSAIPDIVADRKAKVFTTAAVIGHKKSLYLCALYWIAFALWMTQYVNVYPTLLLAYVYPVLPLILVHVPKQTVSKFYWWFPLINTVLGGSAFFTFALPLFSKMLNEESIKRILFENKLWAAVTVIVLFLCSYFLTLSHPQYALFSQIALVLTNIPILYALHKSFGTKGLLIYFVLAFYAWTFESVSILISWPYGAFTYSSLLGAKVLDLAAWTTPLGWIPLFIAAIYIAQQVHKKFKYVVFIVTLVSIDFVLDPAAVSLGFWAWAQPGIYYGVPLINYFGWVVSGTLGYFLYNTLCNGLNGSRITCWGFMPYYLSIILWSGVNIWLGQIIPSLVGLSLGLVVFYFRKKLF